jgi:hypothetical protein
MTIECYYDACPNHGCNHGGEGPFCDMPECDATPAQLHSFEVLRRRYLQAEDEKRKDLERRLRKMGYDLEELELDNPYTQHIGDPS